MATAEITGNQLRRRVFEFRNPAHPRSEAYEILGDIGLTLVNFLRIQNHTGEDLRVITAETEQTIREWGFQDGNAEAILDFERQAELGVVDSYSFRAQDMGERVMQLVNSLPDRPFAPMTATQNLLASQSNN